MGKMSLSVLFAMFLAGCTGFANLGLFAPIPVRTPNLVEAPAAEPEDDGGFFDGLGDLGDIGGGDGMFGGDQAGGGLL